MFHRAAWSVVLGCCFFRARDGAGFVREKIRPARLVGDKSGTKLSQQEENAPNEAILGEQGEFYTENAAARLVQGEFYTDNAAARLAWGEFCTGTGGMWRVLGEFFRATRRCTLVLSATRHRPCCRVWGFCSIRSWLAACRRRVRSLMMQFPPSDGSESATRGVVEPKPQATSLNRAENERLRVKRSAMWATAPETVWCPVWRSRVLEGPSAS